MLLRIIDFDGNYLRDDFNFDNETELGLNVKPSQGLHKPRWSGEITEDEGEWVEGATQEEIDELTKPQPQEPTIEERLAQTEELLQTVTMAFTEYVFTQEMSDDV